MFLKMRLMTPGPTAMAESTRLALAGATPHHRTPAFSTLVKRVVNRLCWLWDTSESVVVISGSGTTAMESAMRSLIAPTDRVLVVTGGKFGERWLELSRMLTNEVIVLPVAWGRSADPAALSALLADEAPVDAVITVASETSTGALHPVAELLAVARAHSPDALSIVDGITAVGCADLSMDRDGIDALISGSQKAFGLPPGAGMVGLNARAWRRMQDVPPTSMALDLRRERGQIEKGQSAFTPPIHLLVGLDEVLARWTAVGRDGLFAHADTLASATRAGCAAIGLRPFVDGTPSPALTSVELPETIDGVALVTRLREHWGISLAGGQEELKGRLLRIGHLGAVDAFDVLHTLAALEMALHEAGCPQNFGAACGAAQPLLLDALAQARPHFMNP